GQLDSRFLALPSFLREQHELEWHTESVVPLITLAGTTGGFLPHERVCWLSEKAQATRVDDQGRFHSEFAPSIEYKDWGIYCWHGIVVDKRTILAPETLSILDIETEPNLETRRIMITRYGESRFLEDSGANVVDDDPAYGILYRKVLARD